MRFGWADINTEGWKNTKTTKANKTRVIDIDPDTLKVLASYKVTRAEVLFELAKANAYVFGDDNGDIRSPDAMTSQWDRHLKKIAAFDESMTRLTIKGLRHTHTTLLLELGNTRGGAGPPRALHHHHHDEQLQPHQPDDAESRRQPLRGLSRER